MSTQVVRQGQVVPMARQARCRACGRATEDARMLVCLAGRFRVVRIADITALLAGNKYVDVVTSTGSVGLTNIALASLLEQYPDEWIRVHRAAAVRLSAIRGTLPSSLHTVGALIVDGVHGPVTVAKRRAAEIHRALLDAYPFAPRR